MEYYSPAFFPSEDEHLDTLVEERAYEEWASEIESHQYLESEWD
jgi:hypothetical protein